MKCKTLTTKLSPVFAYNVTEGPVIVKKREAAKSYYNYFS